jgi:cysteinyl-tRNA synthetase
MIEMITGLVSKGLAYQADDRSVYFRINKFPNYGKLAHFDLTQLQSTGRVKHDEYDKEHIGDFALWKAWDEEDGDVKWESPWGRGRPGWHAECAAIALSVFGAGVDVHAGGADLRFPHHAYHAAMAEAFTGVRPYARAWLHAGTVRVGEAKMAKSTGNLVLVRDLVDDHPAAAVRLMILDRPWAADWDYSPALLDAAEKRLEDLYQAAGRPSSALAAVPEIGRLLAADLNVAAAIDVGIEEGGAAARTVTATLGLS